MIVADIGMPGEDGYALLTGLRRTEQEQRTTRVPAVAVTAFARSEDRHRALAAGFDEHLPKPIDPERLIAVLRPGTFSRADRTARSVGFIDLAECCCRNGAAVGNARLRG